MSLRLIFAVCLAWAAAQAQEVEQKKDAPPPQEPYYEKSQKQFTFYPGGKLEIVAAAPGNVKVIGWKRGAVMVESERIIRDLPPEKARVLAGQFPLQVRYKQTDGSIRTAAPPAGFVDMSINLTIYVPKDKTDLKIQMTKGDLAIGAMNGWVEATLQAGSFEAKSVSGYFSVSTKTGDLKIEMSEKRWSGYGFTGVTQKGSVTLLLPVEYSAALALETREGELSVDFPRQLVEGQLVPLEAVAKKKGRLLNATVGDGGAPLRLMTFAGDVFLKMAEPPQVP